MQSSWTRRAVEVESPQQAPGRDVPGPLSGVLPKTEPSPLQTRVEESKGLRPAKMKEVHIAPQDKVPGMSLYCFRRSSDAVSVSSTYSIACVAGRGGRAK